MKTVPLRRATRLLNHGGLALVTARWGDRINLMPAAWVVPLSHKPPLVGVAIAPERFTYRLVEKSGEFGLSIPGLDVAERVRLAGELSGHDVPDKFRATGFTPIPAKRIRAPLIRECLAHLECRVVRKVPAGDHTLFVGEVIAAEADPRAFQDLWLLPEDPTLRPLHHLGGDQFAVLERRVSVPLPSGSV